jgi:hypothetical protein
MPDVRVKDLTNEATSAASDDFIALDGATFGTRKLKARGVNKRTIVFLFDGGGIALSAALSQYLRLPWAGTITKISMMADRVGSATIDVWEDSWANFPPTVADSKTTLTLTSAQKAESGTLSIPLAADDVIACNLTAPATITRLTVALEVNLS